MMSFWTEERIETLRHRHADGASFSAIGAELGCSRNAALGKAHRIGLPGRAQPATSRLQPKPKQRRTAKRVEPKAFLTAPLWAIAPDEYSEPVLDLVVPIGQRRTLLELTAATCRWPVGDPRQPGFFFCGGNTLPGLPYCHYHSRIAYQPAKRRSAPLATMAEPAS